MGGGGLGGPLPGPLHQRGGERGVQKHVRLKGEPTVEGTLWRGLPLFVAWIQRVFLFPFVLTGSKSRERRLHA